VSGAPTFRPDLYRGTSAFYDRYRLPYPDALVDDLCARTSVSGHGRMLDLACGPGTATFPLSGHFAEVWAVDQEPEAVAFAADKAARLGIDNVRWMTGRAEDVDTAEVFDVVTIGTAFHRLKRRRVAERAMQWLRDGGHLALLWGDTALNGTAHWQQVLAEIVVDWMQRTEGEDRLPAGLEEHLTQLPHTAVLEDAGFVIVGREEFEEIHDWSLEELIGLVYSTSLLPRAVLGDRVEAFEADVRERLGALEPTGVFRERASFAYDLAHRAPSR
jgi:SAM-dependent methyltransferase